MFKLAENNLIEQPSIEWFKRLGYEYKFGARYFYQWSFLELKNNFANWEDLGL